MEVHIAMNPPTVLYVVLVVIFVPLIAALIIRKMAIWQRLIGAVVVMGALIGIMLFFFIGKGIDVDSSGVRCNVEGLVFVPWTSVEHAYELTDLHSSIYEPVRKVSGLAYKDYKGGWFTLRNGSRGFCATEAITDAIVLKTKEEIFVFCAMNNAPLIREVAAHVAIEKVE